MTDLAHLFDREPWPHQLTGVQAGINAIESGTATCITSPTGGGKTSVMIALLRYCAATGRKAILYTNRNLLLDQTMRSLDDHKVWYGVIAAKHRKKKATLRDIQIAMIQTVHARKKDDGIFPADVVIVDEAHLAASGSNYDLLKQHERDGAVLIGITATPLGVSALYQDLCIAGTNSSCRACGALVPAIMRSPWQMDCRKIRLTKTGEFNIQDIRKEVWNPAIIGHVHHSWKEVNPEARPALGFAPGVQESMWFVDEFAKRGVRCAHIDGNDVYVDGETHASDPDVRAKVIAETKSGDIKIIWNRYVLREGLNMPWLYHLILATPIGSLQSYIQTVGRVLRYSKETPDHVEIVDHGGSYWRHRYSPNDNIPWGDMFLSEKTLPTRMHYSDLREGKEQEPITCPFCGVVRRSGPQCPPPPWGCGKRANKKQVMVVQHDGRLVPIRGGRCVPRKRHSEKPNTMKLWESMYHRMKRADKSFSQAEAFFCHTHGYWPKRDLPLMPRRPIDWFRKIQEVGKEELISPEEHRELRST